MEDDHRPSTPVNIQRDIASSMDHASEPIRNPDVLVSTDITEMPEVPPNPQTPPPGQSSLEIEDLIVNLSNLESPSGARKATDSSYSNAYPISPVQSTHSFSAALLAPSPDILHNFPAQEIEYQLPDLPDLNHMRLLEWVEPDGEDDEKIAPFFMFADPEGNPVINDDRAEARHFLDAAQGQFVPPPSLAEAEDAILDLLDLLHPQQEAWQGYRATKLDDITKQCLEQMKIFLGDYIRRERADPGKIGNWRVAAEETAKMLQHGVWATARQPRLGNNTAAKRQ
jgi:hypothetical protein